jgi:hypothetical protein
MNLKKMGWYLRVNLFGPGLRLMEKRIYRVVVSRRLRNTALLSILAISAGLKIFRLVKVTLWDLLLSPFTRGTGCPAVVSGVPEPTPLSVTREQILSRQGRGYSGRPS